MNKVDEALRILNAIQSSGRIEYADYSKLHDAISEIQPEVIRCKECRFAHLTYDGDCKYCGKWTDEFGIPEELYLDGDFFCGYAERRTDE